MRIYHYHNFTANGGRKIERRESNLALDVSKILGVKWMYWIHGMETYASLNLIKVNYNIKRLSNLKNERPTWCHLLFYFNSYVLNMFRTLIYPSSRACDCVVELPHRSSCSQFVVFWRFGAAGVEWCSFCRLKHNFSLQHGHYSKPAAPNLQHTAKQEHKRPMR